MNRRAFTLIELILVMALLGIVLGFAAPSLQRFFRGRTLDAEARRLVSLARYGQTRASSEGVPLFLWLDTDGGRYGLQAESITGLVDSNAVELVLADGLSFELEPATPSIGLGRSSLENPPRLLSLTGAPMAADLPLIRFEPGGALGPDSLERILLRQDEEDAVWIGRGRNRLRYEILTNDVPDPAGFRSS